MNNQNLSSHARSVADSKASQAGVTLIEVIVAMVIFLIVTGVIWGLLRVGQIDRDRSSIRSDVLKNTRLAVNLIGRDAINAGLGYSNLGANVPDDFLAARFGLTPDLDTERDALTSVVAGNNVNPNDLAAAGARTDIIAFAFNDPTFNPDPTNPNPPGSALNPGASLNLDSFSTSGAEAIQIGSSGNPQSNSNAVSRVNDLYLIEAGSQRLVVMATGVPSGSDLVEIEPGDPLGLNLSRNVAGSGGTLLKVCTTTPPTNCSQFPGSMKRFFLVSYKVLQDGTLVRTTFGNNPTGTAAEQIREEPLAYNIKDFQVKYLMLDGTVSEDPATIDANQYLNMNNVRQVTISITARGAQDDPQTHQPIEIKITSTFSTRNMQYGGV